MGLNLAKSDPTLGFALSDGFFLRRPSPLPRTSSTDTKSEDGAQLFLPALLSDFRSDLVQLQDSVRRVSRRRGKSQKIQQLFKGYRRAGNVAAAECGVAGTACRARPHHRAAAETVARRNVKTADGRTHFRSFQKCK